MIAWICLAEACMSWNGLFEVINPMLVICYTEMFQIFGYTIKMWNYTGTETQAEQYSEILCQSNQYFYSFF